MEFRDVLRRRRMVRQYDEDRRVPAEVVERLLTAAVRAPSAGFTQGWGFLLLDTSEDIARFREAVTPESQPDRWFAAQVRTPLIIVPHANKDAYLDNYARPFFGIPVERIDAYRQAFGVPERFRPIGAISVGYADEPSRDISADRRPLDEVVHRGRWSPS